MTGMDYMRLKLPKWATDKMKREAILAATTLTAKRKRKLLRELES